MLDQYSQFSANIFMYLFLWGGRQLSVCVYIKISLDIKLKMLLLLLFVRSFVRSLVVAVMMMMLVAFYFSFSFSNRFYFKRRSYDPFWRKSKIIYSFAMNIFIWCVGRWHLGLSGPCRETVHTERERERTHITEQQQTTS